MRLSESRIRLIIRDELRENLRGFLDRTRGIEYSASEEDDPTFEADHESRDFARAVKRAWSAEADHRFMDSVTKIHWMNAATDDNIQKLLSSSGRDEISTMGYTSGPYNSGLGGWPVWGKIGFVIQGRTTLASNSMDDLYSGYHKNIPPEVREKYKSSGIRKRATGFNPWKADSYILDSASFDPAMQGENEFIVSHWKVTGVVLTESESEGLSAALKGGEIPDWQTDEWDRIFGLLDRLGVPWLMRKHRNRVRAWLDRRTSSGAGAKVTESRMRSIIREALLTEEVYGKLAFIYTGSKSPPGEFLSFLAKDNLNPGGEGGAVYGAGLYTVYDLDGTQTAGGTYGEYIYKLTVNLDGFISFDDDVTEKIYGDALTPVDQAKALGLDREVIGMLSRVMSENPDAEYTSDVALPASQFLKGIVKGIIFTGREDGKVAAIYDARVVRPVAYRTLTDEKWTKLSDSDMSQFSDRTSGSWRAEKYEKNATVTKKKLMRLFQQYRVMGSSMPANGRVFEGDLDLSEIEFENLIPGLHVKGNMRPSASALELPEGLKVSGDLLLKGSNVRSLPRGLEVGGALRTPASLKRIRYPFKVGGELDMQMTGVTSIPAGTTIGGDCIMSMSLIASLPEGFQVGGNLYLNFSDIESLPKGLRVGGDLDVTGTKVTEIPDDSRVGGKVVGLRRP